MILLFYLGVTNVLIQLVTIFLLIADYMCHVYVRADNLAGVVLSDHEYPHRVAHTLITRVIKF